MADQLVSFVQSIDGIAREDVRRLVAATEEAVRLRMGAARPLAGIDDRRWQKAARLPVLVRALPGFAALWETEVPATHLERLGEFVTVACPCGASQRLEPLVVVYCDPTEAVDGCSRWYLRLEDGSVRVKRWIREGAGEAVAA